MFRRLFHIGMRMRGCVFELPSVMLLRMRVLMETHSRVLTNICEINRFESRIWWTPKRLVWWRRSAMLSWSCFWRGSRKIRKACSRRTACSLCERMFHVHLFSQTYVFTYACSSNICSNQVVFRVDVSFKCMFYIHMFVVRMFLRTFVRSTYVRVFNGYQNVCSYMPRNIEWMFLRTYVLRTDIRKMFQMHVRHTLVLANVCATNKCSNSKRIIETFVRFRKEI